MAAPGASASDLKRAIREFLAANGDSPAAGDLRKAEQALGASNSPGQRDTPGSRVARNGAGEKETPFGQKESTGETSSASEDRSEGASAKPNSPGADMNAPSSIPFKGIKDPNTAKALARLRFKSKKH